MTHRHRVVFRLGLGLVVLGAPLYGDFNYANFGSVSGISLKNAAQFGNTLRLITPPGPNSGAAWYVAKQNVQIGFTTFFQFRISGGVGDGFTFAIQNSSLDALGQAGGFLGYSNDFTLTGGIPNSLVVEFDTYNNGLGRFNDPGGRHVSVQSCGFVTNDVSCSLGSAARNVPIFDDGNVHTANIVYAPGQLSVFVDDLTTPVHTIAVDLSTKLSLSAGTAFVGFTAGQAQSRANVDILNWSFGVGCSPSAANISAVRPVKAGNTGSVTTTILGCGFASGATVKLARSGLPDIVASAVTANGSTSLTATFDFRGHTPGVRDVVVTNPGKPPLILVSGFTVEQGGASDVRISKTGMTPVPGRVLDYFIIVENRGSVDSSPFVLSEFVEPWFTFVSAGSIPTTKTQLDDLWPTSLIGTGTVYDAVLLWSLPSLGVDSSRILNYSVRLDGSFPPGQLVTGGVCITEQHCEGIRAGCIRALKFTCSPDNTTDPRSCVTQKLLECQQLYKSCLRDIRNTAGFFSVKAAEVTNASVGLVQCAEDIKPARAPVDPNEKLSSHGRFIRSDQALTYPIHYENIGNAEAQDVFITDVLDPNLDASTLQLLTPGATFDATTRTVKWSLLNKNLPPKATDNVLLSIKPRPNLPSGTTLKNKATIQFEIFAPLTTNETVNIIDTTTPVCKVNTLPTHMTTTSIPVAWIGTDAIGEVATYSLFVSINSGPFSPMTQATTNKSTTYVGQVGNAYSFY